MLVIDGDLRHATLSELVGSPKPGLSDYLAGIVADVHDVIVRSKDAMTVPDTLPAGSIPPNPVELLADRRLADAIAVLRNEYDVIIIDCPPVEIVTDARVINDYVDRTLFVVRAGQFDKAMLPDLDALYRAGSTGDSAASSTGPRPPTATTATTGDTATTPTPTTARRSSGGRRQHPQQGLHK